MVRFFEAVGFIFAFVFFAFFVYSIFSGSLAENLIAILAFFLAVLFISFICPKYVSFKILVDFKSGLELFGRRMNFLLVSFVLILVYVLAVGPLWLLSRILGKDFLSLNGIKKFSEKKSEIDLNELF